MQQTKILLDESDIPTHWYNVVADMPNPPAPPLFRAHRLEAALDRLPKVAV